MSEDETPEAPKVVDKRAGRRAIIDAPTDYSKNQNRLTPVRWALGENPHDDLAVKGSGWVDYKVELHEPEAQANPIPASTTDSRVRCFNCGGASGETYRVIDKRDRNQVAAARDDVSWALHNNRHVDPRLFPDVFLLRCLKCGHVTQMDDETMNLLALKTELRSR